VSKIPADNIRWRGLSALLLLLLSPSLVKAQEIQQHAVISIIIDDIGYHQLDRQMIELPGKLTFAVLPNGPQATKLARYAHQQGKEVMLHMPMQSTLGLVAEVGVLNIDMQESRVVEGLQRAFAKVPYAVGLNNHQGSLLTRHPGHMGWVMKELFKQGYFFVDSRTSKQSVAEQVANEQGVPAIRRDVFLDHEVDRLSIEKSFHRLLATALKKGHAVAIGHPYPETLAVLQALLPTIKDKGIRLEFISYQLQKSESGWAWNQHVRK